MTEKIKLQWQNHIYELDIKQPWATQHDNAEARAQLASSIDDEPKQIVFCLCESIMEPTAPDSIHPYLEKILKRRFSVGDITDKNGETCFKLYESTEHGTTVMWINNSEARIELGVHCR